MSNDFITIRVRREAREHARQLEKAIEDEGLKHLPPELRGVLSDGGVPAITEAGYQLIAKMLGVELDPPGRNGASGA